MKEFNIFKVLYSITLMLFFQISLYAHPNFILHGEDIMAVFGFKHNTKLFNRSKNTQTNNSWVKFISSDMIDNKQFHTQLEQKHKGFRISSPKKHRLLFHWAYDVEPWSPDLEEHIKKYCQDYDLNIESNIRIFKAEVLSEQKRRNRLIIKRTEDVFGFAHGGVDRIYSHFFSSMAYNIHILGDYMTGSNTVLEGLYDFNKLVGQIVKELRKLDDKNSKNLIKGISKINNKNIGVQYKADELMGYLKRHVPYFIKHARNGNLERRLEGRGYQLK